jgi:hypothetical protein
MNARETAFRSYNEVAELQIVAELSTTDCIGIGFVATLAQLPLRSPTS